MIRYLIIISLSFVFFSCSQNNCESCEEKASINSSSLKLKYAKGFEINYFEHHTEIKIKHPNSGELVQRLILSDTSMIKPINPLVFSSSTTHLAFIDALSENKSVKGFENINYVYNPTYLSQFDSNETIDIAIGETIDLEKVATLKPDMFFISGLLGRSTQYERVEKLGIPIIEVVEWVEIHPLARAEWIKFFAEFYGKQKLADSIFSVIESEYLSLVDLTQKIDSLSKPKVLTGSSFRGNWSLPGGKNYASIFLIHAGAYYPNYYTNRNSESIPYDLESVLSKFSDAQLWLHPGASSLKKLLDEDSRYSQFEAFKSAKVFEVNRRMLPNGANDYWETSIIRPDYLLRDLIKIIHPELLPNHELYFYQKLE